MQNLDKRWSNGASPTPLQKMKMAMHLDPIIQWFAFSMRLIWHAHCIKDAVRTTFNIDLVSSGAWSKVLNELNSCKEVMLINQMLSASGKVCDKGESRRNLGWPLIFRKICRTFGFFLITVLFNTMSLANLDQKVAASEQKSDTLESEMMAGASGTTLGTPLNSTYFTIASGIALSGGLRSDAMLLNLLGSFSVRYTPALTAKILADLSFGTGSDSSHFNDFSLGVDYSPRSFNSLAMKPYVGGDIGYGISRDIHGRVGDGIVYAANMGFRTVANKTAVEIGLRYELLANLSQGTRPQLLGLAAAVDF